MKSKKVYIIGVDGATFDLIKPWIKDGELPTFKNLLGTGIHGELESVFPPVTAPAWSSFLTGKTPAQHGVFDFTNFVNQKIVVTSYKNIASDNLITTLEKRGYSFGFLGVPMTYPPEKVKNGFIVAGPPAPTDLKIVTYPLELYEKMIEDEDIHFIPDQHEICLEGKEQEYIDLHITRTKMITKVSKNLYKKYKPNVFMTYYPSTDAVSHWFWRFYDKNHPKYDKKKANKYSGTILEIYKEIDSSVKTLIKPLSNSTLIFIVSDHGFGPVYKAIYLNNLFVKNKLMFFKQNFHTQLKRVLFESGLTIHSLYSLISKFYPSGTSKIEKRMKKENLSKNKFKIKNLINKILLSLDDVDWKKTAVYSYGNYNRIYFTNRKKNEEYYQVVKKVAELLKELRDPETDEKIVEKVFLGEDLYNKSRSTLVPDIVFFTKDFKWITSRHFEFGSKEIIRVHPRWSGGHRINGIFIAKGKNIKNGEIIKQARIIDILPTVYHTLDIPISPEIEGKVLLDIFKENSKEASKPINIQSKKELEKEKIKEIAKRLRF